MNTMTTLLHVLSVESVYYVNSPRHGVKKFHGLYHRKKADRVGRRAYEHLFYRSSQKKRGRQKQEDIEKIRTSRICFWEVGNAL